MYTEQPDSIYLSIIKDLQKKITSGIYPPGSRLPSEMELSEQYGVSRGTVRQALKVIQAEGLLARSRGRGTYVNKNRTESEPSFVGLVMGCEIGDSQMDIVPSMLSGIERYFNNLGIQVRVYDASGNDELMVNRAYIEKASGIAVFPPEESFYNQHVYELQSKGFPIVTFGRPYMGVVTDCAMANNENGSFQAVDHLVRLGHKRIAFFSPSSVNNQSVASRYIGYRSALLHNDIAEDPELVLIHEDLPVLMELLKSEDRPTAVFAVNDGAAMAVLRTANMNGFHVPDDLAVVGFDNVPLSAIYMVPLTTVNHPGEAIGRTAAQMLWDKMCGKQGAPHCIYLPTDLVIRESCGMK